MFESENNPKKLIVQINFMSNAKSPGKGYIFKIFVLFQPSCFHLSHQICITYVKGFVLYSLEERDNRKRGPRNQFGPKIFLGAPKRLAILCLKHCKRTKWNININIHIYICHIFFIHSSVD